jgi:hypothetical protein
MDADMDHAEALKHLRILINVASQTDDMDEVQAIIRQMLGVVDNALRPVRRPRKKPAFATLDVTQIPRLK